MLQWLGSLWRSSDHSPAGLDGFEEPVSDQHGEPVNWIRREYNWTYCHKVGPVREPHKVRLEFIELIHSNQASTWIRSLYRCGECGQRYLYMYNEISDWTSHGDRDFESHGWFPISAEEMEHIRTTRDTNITDRPHLNLEF